MTTAALRDFTRTAAILVAANDPHAEDIAAWDWEVEA